MLLTPHETAPEPPPDRAARGPLRIVVADDAVLLREGLVRLLAEDGHQVVAAVGDGPALVEAVLRHRPDVSVVDVRMPPTHTDEEFLDALDRVARGATVLDPQVIAQLLAGQSRNNALGALTVRERQLLALLAEGHSNTAIAQRLVISASAVEKHTGPCRRGVEDVDVFGPAR